MEIQVPRPLPNPWPGNRLWCDIHTPTHPALHSLPFSPANELRAEESGDVGEGFSEEVTSSVMASFRGIQFQAGRNVCG